MQVDRVNKLQAFLLQEPNSPFLKYALATEYVSQGNLKEALSYFEALVSEHPDYVGTYYHLAKLYLTLGTKEKAIQTYESGINVAKAQKNQHALAELQNAYTNILFDE